MEIIEVSGYTIEEKVEIAKRHLIPKQLEEHALTKKEVKFSLKGVKAIVEGYTRESGVRGLERKIGSVVRYVAKSIALEEEYSKEITDVNIEDILGPKLIEKEVYENSDLAGVVTGLAWTSVGGEILSIESILSKGKGKLTLSGQLGDVMKESAVIALSILRSNAEKLDIDSKVFDQYDLHIHVPAGAVPKDGPSAGITMYTSLASTFTQRKIKTKLAMTGEITLSGRVLPVGGIKEKILAAKRAGIKEIIMCNKNKKDLKEIGDKYLKGLKINFVSHASEVLDLALLPQKVKNAKDLKVD
jgi:ATP-dependent Lon protease